jgi:hypothetical protein
VLVTDYFFFSVLNETPNRIAALRMRSGVRFMIRAASSNDFDALASSITRRSCAKDQALRAIVESSFEDKAASGVCSLTALLGDRTRAIARRFYR